MTTATVQYNTFLLGRHTRPLNNTRSWDEYVFAPISILADVPWMRQELRVTFPYSDMLPGHAYACWTAAPEIGPRPSVIADKLNEYLLICPRGSAMGCVGLLQRTVL